MTEKIILDLGILIFNSSQNSSIKRAGTSSYWSLESSKELKMWDTINIHPSSLTWASILKVCFSLLLKLTIPWTPGPRKIDFILPDKSYWHQKNTLVRDESKREGEKKAKLENGGMLQNSWGIWCQWIKEKVILISVTVVINIWIPSMVFKKVK